MANFFYKAKQGPEKKVEGRISASSHDDAVRKLLEMGLSPISVSETHKAAAHQEHFHIRLSQKRKIQIVFTRQLASLVKAGIPILQSLSIVRGQTRDPLLEKIFSRLADAIRDGKRFSEGLEEFPDLFGDFYCSIVRVGEKTGNLDQVLRQLSDYAEKEEEFHQQLQAALAYPLLITLTGVVTVILMLGVFLPKMTGLFQQFDELPMATRILLKIQDFFQNYGGVFIAAVSAGLIFLFAYKAKNRKSWSSMGAHFKIPLIHSFLIESEITKFTRVMSLLLKSGVPIQDGLELASAVFTVDFLKTSCLKARQLMLAQGIRLSEGLKNMEAFPSFALNMIAIGEESGRLDEMLNEVSYFFEKEMDQRVKIITKILEPVLILVIGAVIGFIVLAFLLPIFNMSTVIK